MLTLNNVPIKRKLMLISLVTSCVALLLACVCFVTYEQITFRKFMVRDLSVKAAMVGSNSSAALSFNDPTSAQDTLKFLSAEPHIVAACIYDAEGNIFATYLRGHNKGNGFPFPQAQTDTQYFGKQDLSLFRRIQLAGETIGTVFLQSDLEEMQARLQNYVLIACSVMLASILAALVLSAKLQRYISRPILHLAATANAVSAEKNYSLRATKQGEDELGLLIDGFNHMLSQIQEQDSALQQARDHLERRVQERTAELKESEALFRAMNDSSPLGVYVTDPEGSGIYTNRLCQEIVGMGPEEILGNGWTRTIHTEDRDRVLADWLRFTQEKTSFDCTFRFLHRDGAVIWTSVKAGTIRNSDSLIGFVGTVEDITQKKKAEAELEAAHKYLLETSRQAGMAEVATAVLHNVGNVLNSVNVSVSLMTDGIRKSKLPGLTKAVGLMHEQSTNLGDFLTHDAKGKQLPDYLKKLAEHLGTEQAGMLQELSSLSKNIEHIKDIVSMQQAYARVSGVAESIVPAELVDDALRMNAGALTRHDVQVIREYSELPKILVEKHKVLQILVNLISNAKYAMEEANPPVKQLVMRMGMNGNNHFKIAVIDNGVGISAENLTRIFAHGFTTKKTGHGFGLHSSALAAKEMGGTLHVHSEGIGKGASFTLELPLKLGEEAHG